MNSTMLESRLPACSGPCGWQVESEHPMLRTKGTAFVMYDQAESMHKV